MKATIDRDEKTLLIEAESLDEIHMLDAIAMTVAAGGAIQVEPEYLDWSRLVFDGDAEFLGPHHPSRVKRKPKKKAKARK